MRLLTNTLAEDCPARSTWLSTWPPPPMSEEEIHIWCIDLDAHRSDSFLCPSELNRAERLYSPLGCNRWSEGRSSLRQILGAYLNKSPKSIRFQYGLAGKPCLSEDHGELAFNIAHCEGWAFLALQKTGRIGIDVEVVRPLSELASLAQFCFSSADLAIWKQLPADRKLAGFYQSWTTKEALVKAFGVGLTIDLTAIDVTVDPRKPAACIADRTALGFDSCQVLAIPLTPSWVGTMATSIRISSIDFLIYKP